MEEAVEKKNFGLFTLLCLFIRQVLCFYEVSLHFVLEFITFIVILVVMLTSFPGDQVSQRRQDILVLSCIDP